MPKVYPQKYDTMKQNKLISPNPTCRRIGCQTTVPSDGGYPGMPQSHCYRCGMKTCYAADWVKEDFALPIRPEINLWDAIKFLFA